MGYNRRAHKIQNLRSKGISMAFVEQRANGRQVTLISCWPLLRLLIRGLGFDKKRLGLRLAAYVVRKTLSLTLNSHSEFITSGISRGGIWGGEKGNLPHFLQFQLNPQQSQRCFRGINCSFSI
uniref:Uncharacterized protein n=12 Tax=Solanum TaxID=4107 RepID=A0A494GA97_SOLLC|nr:hypothetical protein [Solanum melongena]QMQ97349.1 hypothetical protein [Solanum aethiopicum]QMQ97448.1 hypothetical protein [Solanum wrightii]QMQ97643.1 hypothetical protein [Solanum sisymbriifolium]QMQ98013.1 hypothetical protein [Solanum torvum]QMQ98092.1 hypothetical protein [Solanum anguivi]QPF97045.1 hypothetical protein [Solanum stenotomum subsp. goniocalyx]QPF97185.1 hypothetical protein [Solanum ahanhuiri]QPF97256.1 hypothetical protein [Solanum phureja]QPF97323.1 hypothetical 